MWCDIASDRQLRPRSSWHPCLHPLKVNNVCAELSASECPAHKKLCHSPLPLPLLLVRGPDSGLLPSSTTQSIVTTITTIAITLLTLSHRNYYHHRHAYHSRNTHVYESYQLACRVIRPSCTGVWTGGTAGP